MKQNYYIFFILTGMMNFFCTQNEVKKSEVKLPSLVGDNMVLQQNSDAALWGWGTNGETITITTGWDSKSYTTKSDSSGKWLKTVKTPAAGGPFQIELATKDTTITLKNILIGEVWVCSGQSNMAMKLSEAETANEEPAKADNYPQIRFFTVERTIGISPQDDVTGRWSVCAAETAKEFSAVGYFFGKHLHEKLSVPVGLVNTSWGGTPAEAWTSLKAIKELGDFDEKLKEIGNITDNDLKAAQNKLDSVKALQTVLLNHEEQKNTGIAEQWMQTELNETDWKTIEYPTEWSATDIGIFEGIMWSRKTIEIPQAWNEKELILSLGPVDEMDATYYNGKLVGVHNKIDDWDKARNYTIAASDVKAGKAVIAIRIANTYREGGLFGKPEQLKIYPKDEPDKAISLAGEWLYKIAAHFPKKPVANNPHTPTFLYNGMIHPLLNMTIKGAIWYQGESNAARAYQYRKLFPAMITDWRDNWKQGDFSFYFVQIAPFDYGSKLIGAELREAQLLTLDKVKNTGMAVIMDIGNVNDIHPKNKRDVGKRLALWALAKDYGKSDMVYSGPLYDKQEVEGDKIRIFFKHTGSRLVARNGELTHFEIAGADKEFYPANAEIDSTTVVVHSPKVPKPVAVRFAWKNYANPNLFNEEGLPASSFATDNWKRKTQNSE